MELLVSIVVVVVAIVGVSSLSPRAKIWTGGVLGVVGVVAIVVGTSLFSGEPTYGDYTYREAIRGLVVIGGLLIGLFGGVLVAIGRRGERRSRESAAPRSGDSNDSQVTGALGHWVDGTWRCFEHERSWCPTCSARLRTKEQASTPSRNDNTPRP